MSDGTTLLPCPFCGGEPEMHYTRPTEGIREGWLIWCHKCHAGGNWHTKEEDAIRTWNTRITHGTLTAEQIMAIAGRHQPDYCSDTHVCFDWQAIADELNAELGNDDDYEGKMDALLCRLTNGKWSKSRAYDLDFMEQCINEEFEMFYAKEPADVEPGNGTCEIKQHRCTSCDHEINDDAYYVRVNLGNGAWTAESRHANFCPNCGRRVVE